MTGDRRYRDHGRDEQRVIERVYEEIVVDGPITSQEIADRGLEERRHIDTITSNLERIGKIRSTATGWVEDDE